MYRRQLRERQKKLHAKLAVMRQERDARISAHTEYGNYTNVLF
jgi:hypothetical protein